MAGTKKYTVKEMCAAIKASNGMVTKAASLLGCSPNTIYAYAKKYPSVQEALEYHREFIVDLAESKLLGAVNRNEAWAVRLVLQTLGAKRGYVEKIEHGTTNGEPLPIRIIFDPKIK